MFCFLLEIETGPYPVGRGMSHPPLWLWNLSVPRSWGSVWLLVHTVLPTPTARPKHALKSPHFGVCLQRPPPIVAPAFPTRRTPRRTPFLFASFTAHAAFSTHKHLEGTRCPSVSTVHLPCVLNFRFVGSQCESRLLGNVESDLFANSVYRNSDQTLVPSP